MVAAAACPSRFCLIIEFCEGGNLWEVLRRQPETIDFLSMALQVGAHPQSPAYGRMEAATAVSALP